MKQIKDIKNKIEWEEYYNPDFNWNSSDLYVSNNTLTEDFIREFKDRVNWEFIAMSQKLSEDFIREFQDRVSWQMISINQKLSEDFRREFQDRIK